MSSVPSCVTTCAWPNAKFLDTYDGTILRCDPSCPANTFLSRADQSCLSSCDYRNATQDGGNTVCEVAGNGTNCPFLKFDNVNDTFLTCVSSCSASDLRYANGTFTQCVYSCPSVAKYI